MCDLKLSDLHAFYNKATSMKQKRGEIGKEGWAALILSQILRTQNVKVMKPKFESEKNNKNKHRSNVVF